MQLRFNVLKRFEYKTILVPCQQKALASPVYNSTFGNFNEEEFLLILQQHGEEGWELVQVLPYPHKYRFFVYASAGDPLVTGREISYKAECYTQDRVDARLVFKRETAWHRH